MSSRQPAVGIGVASAPATCGELAQGILDGTPVMATCPIDMFSTVTVDLVEGSGRVHGPANSFKACRAVELTLALMERTDVDAQVNIESCIPRKKGMASSTADIIAAIAATGAALDADITASQQAELALSIEPSDGTMLPGIALFDYKHGSIARSLGCPPDMRILVLEFEGDLDTESFNAVNREAELRGQSPLLRDALELITEGIESGDAKSVGRGATLSALTYQTVLPKPQLPGVLSLAQDAGAVGVNVAHSGTVMGLLFGEDADRIAWAETEASKRLPDLTAVHNCKLIGGGVQPPVHPEPVEG
ncbi:MAG: GHMP kinase [Dehalococcoidia bacterium]|nr:GHMP kinase [Dehalococcoidia bacterium]